MTPETRARWLWVCFLACVLGVGGALVQVLIAAWVLWGQP